MLALQSGRTGEAWQSLRQQLPVPSAILCISAHWETAQFEVSAVTKPETIHDFSGFPSALYEIEYPAAGAPALAEKVRTCLQAAGMDVRVNAQRGLDHGAWVPLREFYPAATLPVAQLSLQMHGGPAMHYALGQVLQVLHADNVLILASGAVTHNLGDFYSSALDAPVLPYVPAFADWLGEAIAQQDIERLLAYRQRTPAGRLAHPSEEHLLPLFVALGAGQGVPQRWQPETCYGILAMDAYVWPGDR